jgi:hypothetical protein
MGLGSATISLSAAGLHLRFNSAAVPFEEDSGSVHYWYFGLSQEKNTTSEVLTTLYG